MIGAIDQTTALEILDVEAVAVTGRPRERLALDEEAWRAVKDRAAARVLELSPAGRASAPVAVRDLTIIICLGELGLRSEELRTLGLDDLTGIRAGSATAWLHIVGKGKRERAIPLPPAVQRPLGAWLDARSPETTGTRRCSHAWAAGATTAHFRMPRSPSTSTADRCAPRRCHQRR